MSCNCGGADAILALRRSHLNGWFDDYGEYRRDARPLTLCFKLSPHSLRTTDSMRNAIC